MSFPTTVNPKAISFSSNRPNSISYTLSGKRSVRQFASQYFSFSVAMPPLNQTQFQEYYAFLVSQKGAFTPFNIEYPLNNQGPDKNSSSVVTRSIHSAGATTVAVDGLTASTNDVIKAGDLIKFNGHDKVYLVTGDVNSNGSGQGSINIEPPLQASTTDNEAVDLNKPVLKVALSQDDILYSTDATGVFDLSFDVREVL